MTFRSLRDFSLLSLLLALGCGQAVPARVGPTYVEDQPEFAVAVEAAWPEEMVTSPGTGPALYLSDASDALPFGYVSSGVTVELAEPPANGRVKVRIRGALKVLGYLSMDRAGLIVQERGRVPGTPAYVGPGDLVRLADLPGPDGVAQIEVQPAFPGADAIVGRYPMDRLASTPAPESAEAPTEGTERYFTGGEEVAVYDRPNGSVIQTLPANGLATLATVLREDGDWTGVRIGTGPYIVGFVNHTFQDVVLGAAVENESDVPARLRSDDSSPLARVAQGTRVRFGDQTIAIFDEAGYARVVNRYEDTNEADVFAATNDDIAVRGIVPLDALEEVTE